MARIYRTTDIIPVKIDDITVYISPMGFEQKSEIQEAMLGFTKGDVKAATRGVVLSLKYALKKVDGIEDSDGKPYQLEIENGMVTDKCIDDLMNLELSSKLTIVCSSLLNGVPTEFLDNNDKPMEGVEILNKVQSEKKS